MPRTARQFHAMRAATRENILETALQLFAEEGYAATSIRKIAAVADISPGLVYHYFANKEALLGVVLQTTMSHLSARFAAVALTAAPLEKVSQLIDTLFRELVTDPVYWGLFYSLRAQPAVTAVLGDELRAWTTRLRHLFILFFREAGRAQPEVEAYMLYSLIEGTLQQYLLDPRNYPLADVIARMKAQFGAG